VVPLNRPPVNWPLQAPRPQDMRWLRVEDASAVSACRQAVQVLAERLQFPVARVGQLALAVTEAASNLHKHAEQGSLLLCVNRDGPRPGIDLVTIDAGPGMRDVSAAMRDGHSTAGTLGIGLGAIQRLADFADLYSAPGHSTALAARFCAVPSGGTTPQDPPGIGGAARPPRPPWAPLEAGQGSARSGPRAWCCAGRGARAGPALGRAETPTARRRVPPDPARAPRRARRRPGRRARPGRSPPA
jgi:anti-sigma regulatory factor (Ser/Thr protein kinase)